MDLAGRRVLVTGASRGIGAECVKAFAAAGATVALAARTEGAIKELAAAVGGLAYPVDLADGDQVDGFIARVEQDGPLDVLVNNAGVETTTLFAELPEDEITAVLTLNLMTPLRLTRQALPGMLERGRGHVVQVSSLAGVGQMPGAAVYGASKAGLTHSASTIEMELKGRGIGMTTVHLGPVETSMIDRAYAAEQFTAYWRRLHRLQLLTDVGPEIVARDIVEAVRKGKRFVLHPKRALMIHTLNDVPRRVLRLALAGIRYR